jgi:hypothetical protein
VFALSLIRHVCAVRLLDGEQVVLGLDGDHFCIALFADIKGLRADKLPDYQPVSVTEMIEQPL